MIRIALACLILATPTLAAAQSAKQAFGAKRAASAQAPAPHGSYAKGCLAGGVELAETGPAWQAMRLSRNRNWGHPATIALIERLSARARDIGWPGLYIGDISQPRGGPMLSGHRSHQMGLDVDIWMLKAKDRRLSRAEREAISSINVVAANRNDTNANWTAQHHQVLKAAASDPAVARIFVNAAIKRRMCRDEPQEDRAWLGRIRPWYGHDHHFHVRLLCPESARGCFNQAPPPPGDGCDATLDWWFSDEARNPKPKPGVKPKPRRAITLADLPAECRGVLNAD